MLDGLKSGVIDSMDGFHAGWLKRQVAMYKSGKLSNDKRRMLEELHPDIADKQFGTAEILKIGDKLSGNTEAREKWMQEFKSAEYIVLNNKLSIESAEYSWIIKQVGKLDKLSPKSRGRVGQLVNTIARRLRTGIISGAHLWELIEFYDDKSIKLSGGH